MKPIKPITLEVNGKLVTAFNIKDAIDIVENDTSHSSGKIVASIIEDEYKEVNNELDELRSKLRPAEEHMDRLTRENNRLREKIIELEKRNDSLERMIIEFMRTQSY